MVRKPPLVNTGERSDQPGMKAGDAIDFEAISVLHASFMLQSFDHNKIPSRSFILSVCASGVVESMISCF